MAILKRTRMKKETAKKKEYLKHFKRAKASSMTYVQWTKAGGKKSPDVMLREIKAKPFRRKVKDILAGK